MSTALALSYGSCGLLRLTDSSVSNNTALERLSASARALPRHSSCGERSYLARLIQKYGDDYESMARDRRLNPEQKTVGELRKAVGRAGGIESFS